ncbi:MAG: class I SAM-dependent methyltransferase [Rubrivivax sp.]|nr:class I SAM-dependent methyltransferase [Rubrivivax sp.]
MSELDRIRGRYRERDADAALTGFWTLRNPVVLHLAQERERRVLQALTAAGVALAGRRLLDVGCGAGQEFGAFLRWGADPDLMWGVDLSLDRLATARQCSTAVLALASGSALPFPDASFDLVCQNVVFSSIVDAATRRATAAEMRRVLRPGGHLLWYDAARTRSRDPHFRPVPRAEVEALFPGLRWRWQSLSSDLGVLRRVGAGLGEPGMCAVDMLRVARTHLLGLGMLA